MSRIVPAFVLILCAQIHADALLPRDENDPYLWLESIESARSMAWVHAQNDSTLAALTPRAPFRELYERNLKVYNSVERIAMPDVHAGYVYNLWKDEAHERGLWRRTTVDDYTAANPVWENVLDFDSLSSAEGKEWVFAGADFLRPSCERCMLSLSRGGSDAVEIREFDLRTKRFVASGFKLPEAKSGSAWRDANTLLIASGLDRDQLTTSGYPRTVKVWKRGTPIESAAPLFAGDTTDMGSWAFSICTTDREYFLVVRGLTMFKSTVFALERGTLVQLDIPVDASLVTIMKGQVILWLKTDWRVGDRSYAQGALVGVDYDDLLAGRKTIHPIWTPTGLSCIYSVSNTRNLVILNVLDNVQGELFECSYRDAAWAARRCAGIRSNRGR